MKRRVLIIGLDGASLDIINKGIENNILPNFKTMIENGICGNLRSTMPPKSAVAWSSFMTGKNPGKHGVFDWTRFNSNYETEMLNGGNIMCDTIWKLLGLEGKFSILVNIPFTYPPEKINGIVFTGIETPGSKPAFHPENLEIPIELMYDIKLEEFNEVKNITTLLNMLKHDIKTKFDLFRYLIHKYEWDLSMIAFYETDYIQHKVQYHREKILELYKYIDELIGEIIDTLTDDDILIVLSDHGGGNIKKVFHLNTWLKQKELLVTKKLNSGLFRTEFTKENIYNILSKLKLLPIGLWIYKKFNIRIPVTNAEIDFNQSKAFSQSSLGVSRGIIINENSHKEEIKALIKDGLLEIKDPDNKQKIIEHVYDREEIYSGSHVNDAPDLIVITKNSEYSISNRMYGNMLLSKPTHSQMGAHTMDGVLIIYNKKNNKKKILENANILDMAPTILSLFDVPVPTDMDGTKLEI